LRTIRLIGLFIIFGTIAIFISGFIKVPASDYIFLSLILSPMAILQKDIANCRSSMMSSNSIVFSQNITLFRILNIISFLVLIYFMFEYRSLHSSLAAIIFILSGLIIQAPYYVFLRSTLPFDVFLSPLSIIGLILFYIFVLH
jgi:hypothetical protein